MRRFSLHYRLVSKPRPLNRKFYATMPSNSYKYQLSQMNPRDGIMLQTDVDYVWRTSRRPSQVLST